MLTTTKLAMRITTTAYDAEIQRLINAAVADLGIVLTDVNQTDPLYVQAIITYVSLLFGTPEDYVNLNRSYVEQKAQLMTATGYGFITEEQA